MKGFPISALPHISARFLFIVMQVLLHTPSLLWDGTTHAVSHFLSLTVAVATLGLTFGIFFDVLVDEPVVAFLEAGPVTDDYTMLFQHFF